MFKSIKSLNAKLVARIGVPGTAATYSAFVALPASAAVMSMLMGITGTVTVIGTPEAHWQAAASGGTVTAVGDGSGIVCSGQATNTSNRKLTIGVSNAYPGASCTFSAKAYGSTSGLRVQSINLGPDVTTKLATASCGAQLSTTPYDGTPITFTVTIPEDRAASTITLPSTAGVTVLPAGQFDTSKC